MSHETHSLSATADAWSIDLHLRHTSTDELAAFRSLLLDSPAIRAVGGGGTARSTTLRLKNGNGISKYGVALRDVTRFLHKRASHLHAFTASGEVVELVLNHTTVAPEESTDKTLDLWLAPEFLNQLPAAGIGLRIIGWAEVETDSQ